jgi:hypothetical protein
MELINLVINEDFEDKSGVSGLAIVDSPAIESPFMAFRDQNKPQLKKYQIQLASKKGDLVPVEGDQQMLFGAFMIPDMEILRVDPDGKKYNVVFTKETIKKISQKFALSNINTAINEMHNTNMPIAGGIVQHFIIDSKAGINAPYNFNFVDGTWCGYVKVLDKNKWDTIKTGIYTGFSVEGFFYEEPVNSVTDAEQSMYNDLLNEILGQ